MPGIQSRTVEPPFVQFSPRIEPTGLSEPAWFAIYTLPRNEQSVARHLGVRQVESFLPTCTRECVWKNRQRMKLVEPLFPGYVFARMDRSQRSLVLGSPGVARIVGNSNGPLPVSASELEFLRSDFCRNRVEPYREMAVGQRVRVKCGAMQGVEGVLVQKKNSYRFVITVELINQHAAVEVLAEELEYIQE